MIEIRRLTEVFSTGTPQKYWVCSNIQEVTHKEPVLQIHEFLSCLGK